MAKNSKMDYPKKEKKKAKAEPAETSIGPEKAREEPKKRISAGSMDIKQASETAKNKLAEALNKKAESTSSISEEGDGWNAVVEVVDEEFLPGKNLKSMNDIIGVYEVKLSSKGELLSWVKKSSHNRGKPD